MAAAPSASFEVDLMPSEARRVDMLSQLDGFGPPPGLEGGSGAEAVGLGETFGSMSALGLEDE